LALGATHMRLTFEDYVLDVGRRELRRGSERIAVEPQVFDLLVYLVQHPDRVVSKDELLQAVWSGRIVTDSAITNRINAARRAIGDSGNIQRLIRTVPRKGFRFIGTVEESVAEPAKAAASLGRRYRRTISSTFAVAAASALLGAAIAAFVLWPAAGPPLPLAVRADSERAPATAMASEPRLIPGLALTGLPLTAAGNGADQLNAPAGLADMATDLQRGRVVLVTSRATARLPLNKAAAGGQIEPSAQEAKQLLAANAAVAPPPPNLAATAPPAPDVIVTAPPAQAGLPAPRDPGRSFAYAGRDRVAEEKFPETPCTGNRLPGSRGPSCNTAVDEVVCKAGNLAIEANTLIFDPYANRFSTWCYAAGHPEYGEEDFQGMNQVTRRGSNWHNLISSGEDKSIEFFDGQHNCVAVQKAGPRWQRGYVYIVHASICRTDTAAVRTEDVAYALDLLHVRE
jgi:DNA-binding winged helix-turn-helix (wHTH) protein